MKRVQLFHNPGAGDEAHTEKSLKKLFKDAGIKPVYTSLAEKGWKNFEEDVDAYVIAGGDGTVRRVSLELLTHDFAYSKPIGLLPNGTANNIAGSLKLEGEEDRMIEAWRADKTLAFDTGLIEGIDDEKYFLESFGYGAFPYLIIEMHRGGDENIEDREQKLLVALKNMHQLLQTYAPRKCQVEIDGVDYSGDYIMVEVMNTPKLGPNLCLTPGNNLSDQLFEVVLVKEEDRKYLSDYVFRKLHGDDPHCPLPSIKGRKVVLTWHGEHVHVDDKLLSLPFDTRVTLTVNPGQLHFLMP